jgi:hypothetical protein
MEGKTMRLILLTLAFLLMTLNQSVSYAQQPSIVLKGIQGKYQSLNEIKPVLVNENDKSIYLLPEDCGEARVWLFYMNKIWSESLSKTCYDNVSIEIKPGESYQIPPLVWRPLRTKEGKLIERKNFPGKYKIVVRYSLISLAGFEPKLRHILTASSEEFIIAQ